MEYNSKEYLAIKSEILSTLGVINTNKFNAETAVFDRIKYLKNFIKESGLNGFVLGISGGVDSTTVGRMCQIACEELRNEGYNAKFYAVRLPAGVQIDEDDAQEALKFIQPDITLNINIGEASSVIHDAFVVEQLNVTKDKISHEKLDFLKGNVKARMRMIAQYEIAGCYNLAVISTDQNTEACTGFFTKYGDGGVDLVVNNGVNKRQVRLMAKFLEAPERLWSKAPTADLEELNPGKLDDEGFGFAYDELDDFLEGKTINPETEYKIIKQYLITQHKRKEIPKYQPEKDLS